MNFFMIFSCFEIFWIVSGAPVNSLTKKTLKNSGIDDLNADKLVRKIKQKFFLHRTEMLIRICFGISEWVVRSLGVSFVIVSENAPKSPNS